MIWLVSQVWPAALVSLVAGFAVAWLLLVHRLDPAERAVDREDRPARADREVPRPTAGTKSVGSGRPRKRDDAAERARDDRRELDDDERDLVGKGDEQNLGRDGRVGGHGAARRHDDTRRDNTRDGALEGTASRSDDAPRSSGVRSVGHAFTAVSIRDDEDAEPREHRGDLRQDGRDGDDAVKDESRGADEQTHEVVDAEKSPEGDRAHGDRDDEIVPHESGSDRPAAVEKSVDSVDATVVKGVSRHEDADDEAATSAARMSRGSSVAAPADTESDESVSLAKDERDGVDGDDVSRETSAVGEHVEPASAADSTALDQDDVAQGEVTRDEPTQGDKTRDEPAEDAAPTSPARGSRGGAIVSVGHAFASRVIEDEPQQPEAAPEESTRGESEPDERAETAPRGRAAVEVTTGDDGSDVEADGAAPAVVLNQAEVTEDAVTDEGSSSDVEVDEVTTDVLASDAPADDDPAPDHRGSDSTAGDSREGDGAPGGDTPDDGRVGDSPDNVVQGDATAREDARGVRDEAEPTSSSVAADADTAGPVLGRRAVIARHDDGYDGYDDEYGEADLDERARGRARASRLRDGDRTLTPDDV